MGDLKKSDVPGLEALARPGTTLTASSIGSCLLTLLARLQGTKEGQVITVKNARDVVEAHQWSSASQSWQKIGDVTDAIGSNRKQLYQGKEYDYVFDVDIQEGAPPLKLPFNVSRSCSSFASLLSYLWSIAHCASPPFHLREPILGRQGLPRSQ